MGKIYVVGMGPGKEKYMTFEAKEALDNSDIIIGYTVYVDLLREKYKDKELQTTGMRQEVDRCELCLSKAKDGKTVSLVCSGDAGVYGMASLMLQVARNDQDIEIEVVAGVTAALSGGAVLGAPLGHDFCVISLSNLLTPWELIEKRLKSAAAGDFCIAIYNPSSKSRPDHLKKACEILAEDIESTRPCGIVRNIGREEQSFTVCTLGELSEIETDMFTTVFIGNSKSEIINERLVTPRGYVEHEK